MAWLLLGTRACWIDGRLPSQLRDVLAISEVSVAAPWHMPLTSVETNKTVDAHTSRPSRKVWGLQLHTSSIWILWLALNETDTSPFLMVLPGRLASGFRTRRCRRKCILTNRGPCTSAPRLQARRLAWKPQSKSVVPAHIDDIKNNKWLSDQVPELSHHLKGIFRCLKEFSVGSILGFLSVERNSFWHADADTVKAAYSF